MTVIDIKGLTEAKLQLAELKKQVEAAKEQLDTLKSVQDEVTKTMESIGEVGNISVPSVNFTKMSGQIMSDMNCLVPDYKSLMPNVNFDDVSLGSICQRGDAYKKGLTLSTEEMRKGSWQEKSAKQKQVRANRERVIGKATTKGMAHADSAQEAAVEALKAAQEYKSAGSSAQTVNARLQVLIEVNVAQLAQQAQTNQLLAQLLKVQSAATLNTHVGLEAGLVEGAADE